MGQGGFYYMKRQKTNWQKKGIIDIQNRYQLSEQQAKEYWRKAYRVTRLNVKYGNKAYQTYAGFFNNVSYIDFTINKEFDESGAVTGSKLNTKINTELINNKEASTVLYIAIFSPSGNILGIIPLLQY